MITMGSFLEDYQNGQAVGKSLEKFIQKNPNHELALGMKKIHSALKTTGKNDETIIAINQIDHKKYAVEEQLVFLELLYHLMAQERRFNTAQSILASAKRLVVSSLPVEYQSIPISLEANLHFYEGRFKKQAELTLQELSILKPNSGRYILIYWTYLILLAFLNEYEQLEYHIKEFEKIPNLQNHPVSLDYIRLVSNTEKCNFKENEVILARIKANGVLSSIKHGVEEYERFIHIIQFNELPILDEKDSSHWELFSLYSLINNDYKNALEWIHKYADQHTLYKFLSNLGSYTLIRAELANKNINTAELFLESKKKIENTSLFDDFFWFRIYHMKGETKKAQKHFNLFNANVEKYKLDNRFDYELKLSPEIQPKDLRYYIKNYSQNNTPNIEIDPEEKSNNNFQSTKFIIGESQAIVQIKELINKYAAIDTSVLIIGETGTGKELVAKALRQAGPYQNKPFVAINCGAISDHLLQSELFGHKKGAFTGAFQDHRGVFEEAGDGIVFLDEIGEISPAMQINLLRVLEAKEFRPIGSNENKKLNCKVIAATNRNLTEHVKAGHFRQDLQFRLERLTIELPPLRERSSDIPILINHFLNEENPNLPNIFFDASTLKYLTSLPWYGNIRELRNEMEKIRLFYSDKKILTVNELSNKYKSKTPPAEPAPATNPTTNTKKVETSASTSPLNLTSKFRRLEELKSLFVKHNKLTRIEVESLLQVSPNTALSYLNTLEKENFISRKTFANTKTHYYEII